LLKDNPLKMIRLDKVNYKGITEQPLDQMKVKTNNNLRIKYLFINT
jgi:hypothetical protein